VALPKDLLEKLDEVVLPSGFERRGSLYRARRNGNLVVLGLEGGADPDFADFDGHLGVLSARLSSAFGPKLEFTYPSLGSHHWYRWAGDLGVRVPSPSGWQAHKVNGQWLLDDVARYLRGVVLPALDAHSSDEGLRDDWLDNRDTWLTEAEQVAYLIVLVRDIGPADALPGLRQRLRALLANGDRVSLDLTKAEVLDWTPDFDAR
jgi:hypothetical protein